MSTEQKGTLIWRTVVTAALVALVTVVGGLLERDRAGVAACVDVLLNGSLFKSLVAPVAPSP